MIVVSTVHNSRLMHKRSVGFRNFVDVDINQQTLRGCLSVFCLFLVRHCCAFCCIRPLKCISLFYYCVCEKKLQLVGPAKCSVVVRMLILNQVNQSF